MMAFFALFAGTRGGDDMGLEGELDGDGTLVFEDGFLL